MGLRGPKMKGPNLEEEYRKEPVFIVFIVFIEPPGLRRSSKRLPTSEPGEAGGVPTWLASFACALSRPLCSRLCWGTILFFFLLVFDLPHQQPACCPLLIRKAVPVCVLKTSLSYILNDLVPTAFFLMA